MKVRGVILGRELRKFTSKKTGEVFEFCEVSVFDADTKKPISCQVPADQSGALLPDGAGFEALVNGRANQYAIGGISYELKNIVPAQVNLFAGNGVHPPSTPEPARK